MTDTTGPPHRPWYRRPRWIVLLTVVLVLVVGGILFGLAWSQRGAEEASLDDAVARFRREAEQQDAGFLQPATGVYTYDAKGTERLSVLGTHQEWGPTLPATVTRDGRCWTLALEYSTHHRQTYRYCVRQRTLQEVGGTTFQSFDFVATTISEHSDFTCSPPIDTIRVDAKPGDRWRAACDGHSTERDTSVRSAGTNTFEGLAEVRVGTERVPTYHYLVERTLSGSQTGTETTEFWYSARDGLPVKAVRTVRVKSPSPIGDVTYTESGTYLLSSLQPRG